MSGFTPSTSSYPTLFLFPLQAEDCLTSWVIWQLTAGKGGNLTLDKAAWAITFELHGEDSASAADSSSLLARSANTLCSSSSLTLGSPTSSGRDSPFEAAVVESSWPSGSSKGPGIPFKAVLLLWAICFSTSLIYSSSVGVEDLRWSNTSKLLSVSDSCSMHHWLFALHS